MDATLKLFIMKQGNSKIPIDPIFSWQKLWKYFPKHMKTECLTQFYIYHTLVKNSVTLVLFFWALLQAATICNLSKNDNFWGASKTSFKELKKIFDPSIHRSWCEGLEDLYVPSSMYFQKNAIFSYCSVQFLKRSLTYYIKILTS